ncbi:MAG: hypothetical protein NT007_17215 [Candidatus Kapabacteria bacterium]|nr:hypothetical protein [Candidatus Kapabacteria bacterium]
MSILKSGNQSKLEKVAMKLIVSGIVMVIVIFLFLIGHVAFKSLIPVEDVNLFGNIGQLLEGTVGTLWTLAGVLLFYEAMNIQREELVGQKKELELQHQDIMEQTHELKMQNKLLNVQQFESTYFQLINLQVNIVDSIKLNLEVVDGKFVTLHGRECFVEFYNHFRIIFSDLVDITGEISLNPSYTEDLIQASFETFLTKHQSLLGHYFRNVENIYNFIRFNLFENIDFYINLFRSQFSNYELLVLFYYALSEEGKSFRILAEEFSVFNSIPAESLMDFRHKDFFSTRAFDF